MNPVETVTTMCHTAGTGADSLVHHVGLLKQAWCCGTATPPPSARRCAPMAMNDDR